MKKKSILLFLVLCLPLSAFLLSACWDGDGGGGSADILFVDDDNGMNNRGGDVMDDPDVDQVYTADLDALGVDYDVYRVTGVLGEGPDLATLQEYVVVIWATGESYNGDSAAPLTLTLNDQANLAEYLEDGGRLFLSSQDVLYDLMNGDEAGTVDSVFANTYLGVMDAWDDGATLPTTFGVAGDPVSDGYVFTGIDADDNGDVDNFEFGPEDPVGTENGTAEWDSLADPQTLTLTATSVAGFLATVFDGTYDIEELADDALSFDSRSFWAYTNGAVSPIDYWHEPMAPNQYAVLELTADTYEYIEYPGITYTEYPDSINEANPFPAHADTLLVDIDGYAAASRVEQAPWKVVFLALPYEGLGPDADRQDFLQSAIDWLKE